QQQPDLAGLRQLEYPVGHIGCAAKAIAAMHQCHFGRNVSQVVRPVECRVASTSDHNSFSLVILRVANHIGDPFSFKISKAWQLGRAGFEASQASRDDDYLCMYDSAFVCDYLV